MEEIVEPQFPYDIDTEIHYYENPDQYINNEKIKKYHKDWEEWKNCRK